MDWAELAKYGISVAGMSAVFAYIGKKAIESYLSGRLESHKSQLQIAATEHSIRFQRLHSERAEVIRDLYSKISELDIALKDCLKAFHAVGEPDLRTKVERVRLAHNALVEFYPQRRIFLEQDLCTVLDTIVERSGGIFVDITNLPVDPMSQEYQHNRQLLRERMENWDRARQTHRDDIAQLKAELETRFRRILGIAA